MTKRREFIRKSALGSTGDYSYWTGFTGLPLNVPVVNNPEGIEYE